MKESIRKIHKAIIDAGRPLTSSEIAHATGIPSTEVLHLVKSKENDLIAPFTTTEALDSFPPNAMRFTVRPKK